MIVMSWYLTPKTILPSLIAPVLLVFANEGCNMCIEGEKDSSKQRSAVFHFAVSTFLCLCSRD